MNATDNVGHSLWDVDDSMTPTSDTAFFLAIDHNARRVNSRDVAHHDGTLCGQLHESFMNALLDIYAAAQILLIHLATFESLFCVLVTVLATTAYYVVGVRSSTHSTTFGANISWMIVSTAVVAPLLMQIKQAFTRREWALSIIGEARALFVNIYLANAIWNWSENGRQKLPVNHAEKTKGLLLALVNDMATMLLLPTVTRGRHRFTVQGRKLAFSYVDQTQELQLRIVDGFRELHEQVEVMKKAGLPANEASRINQYHWLLQARLERLQNYKFYRTPQGTRSFTRFFILILPLFYGPYYVYLLNSDENHHLNFAFCLTLAVVTSLTMIGLFNVEKGMEDPFVGGGLDGIRVREMFGHLRLMIDHCDSQIHTNLPSNRHVK